MLLFNCSVVLSLLLPEIVKLIYIVNNWFIAFQYCHYRKKKKELTKIWLRVDHPINSQTYLAN